MNAKQQPSCCIMHRDPIFILSLKDWMIAFVCFVAAVWKNQLYGFPLFLDLEVSS
jgi:hypothetical protein